MTDYSGSVQLADRFGNRFGQNDSQHPNGTPASGWTMDQYARDSHTLASLKGTPPGQYNQLVTVYAQRPLSILRGTTPTGVEHNLGLVTVARPEPEATGLLTLADFDLDRLLLRFQRDLLSSCRCRRASTMILAIRFGCWVATLARTRSPCIGNRCECYPSAAPSMCTL